MTDIAIVILVAGVLLVVGIRIGMLVSPRLSRWSERAAEDPHDD
jgi:uncharacterized protein YneF (UPF0154 family)